MSYRPLPWRAFAALLLAGCAAALPSIVVAGKSLKAIGQEFEATSATMYVLCTTNSVSRATCDGYRDFGLKFKVAYDLADKGYGAAVHSVTLNDAGVPEVPALDVLVSQLTAWTAYAGTKLSSDGGTP